MKVNKIIEAINDKREKYIKKYGMFPKRIEINRKYLIELYVHLLSLQEMPYDEMKLFGMEIVLNESVKRLKDIIVY
mgnify:CR=1 FL=1